MNRLHKALERNGGKALLGAAVYSYDPIFLEICARLGYQVIWIEMEHAPITFSQAADLCRMASGTGMLTMIRIPDTRRDSVLKAAECAPDIIDAPMVNTPEQMMELRHHARFAPEGGRGFFSVSRAVNYGIVQSVAAEQRLLNDDLCLMAQIETVDAVERLDELVRVPDVDLFIGPADLAASFGYPEQPSHPVVAAAARNIVAASHAHNKLVATACPQSDFDLWLGLGVDLLFCTNNIACMRKAAGESLALARQCLESIQPGPVS